MLSREGRGGMVYLFTVRVFFFGGLELMLTIYMLGTMA